MDWDALLIKARTLPGFRDDPKTPEWIDAQLALHPYPPDFVEFARAGFAGVTVSLSNIVLRPLDALHDEATDLYGALPDFGMVMVGMDGGGNAVVWNHAHRRLALVDHGFTTHGISKQGDQWCDEDGEPVVPASTSSSRSCCARASRSQASRAVGPPPPLPRAVAVRPIPRPSGPRSPRWPRNQPISRTSWRPAPADSCGGLITRGDPWVRRDRSSDRIRPVRGVTPPKVFARCEFLVPRRRR